MVSKINFLKTSLLFFFIHIGTNIYAQDDKFEDNIPWINFEWQSHELNGRLIEKTAITVPVRIDNLPYKFDAQFDLGAISSMFYENTINPYLSIYPYLTEKIDTTKTGLIQGIHSPVIRDIDLTLDGILFPKRELLLFKGYGDVMNTDSVHTPSVKHIGTIAADLFADKILVIDYPNQRLCGLNTIPHSWVKNFEFVDIEHIKERNWLLLPLQINGNTEKVVFDTGSSLFPVVSSAQKISSIADTTKIVDQFTGSSWGEAEVVYGFEPNVEIKIGTTILESLPVYYSENIDDEMLDYAGFWGLAGNRYFLNKIVILDYKNQRFGISR